MTTSDVDLLCDYVIRTVGDAPAPWPGGYPDEIELALIDAIFSVRAKYGDREKKTGVVGVVDRWRRYRGHADDLTVLAQTPADEVRRIVENNGRLARRPKAEIVVDAARAFVNADIRTASDYRAQRDAARPVYLGVKGCGPVTWRYLRMLLGRPDVKPDTWVMRFVKEPLPELASGDRAAELITEVAGRLDVDVRALDHAIWDYMRRQAPRRTDPDRDDSSK